MTQSLFDFEKQTKILILTFDKKRTRESLGYTSFELIGRTHFDFVHPDDLPIISRAHQICTNDFQDFNSKIERCSLFFLVGKETGNGKSESYRFLSKGQQWMCLQTQCQPQINPWTGKPESYLCTSFILSKYFNFHISNESTFFSSSIFSPTEPIHKQISSSTNISTNSQLVDNNSSRIVTTTTTDVSSDSQITVSSFLLSKQIYICFLVFFSVVFITFK